MLYEYFNTGDNGQFEIASTKWFAQTFTASSAHNVTSVKLLLKRSDTPGTLTVSIRETDVNGHPTGADLTSGTTDGDTISEVTPEWREIALTSYSLTSGVKYAIVARVPDSTIFEALYWRATNSGYAGTEEKSFNSGVDWDTGAAGWDLMFEVWGPAVYTRAITEGLGFADAPTKQSLRTRAITEGLGLADALTTRMGQWYTRAINEGLGFADQVQVHFVTTKKAVILMMDDFESFA